jgi:hypothetical protein
VRRDNGVPAQQPGFSVVPVAAMFWADYNPRIHTDPTVGHIECIDGTFRVVLKGTEFEQVPRYECSSMPRDESLRRTQSGASTAGLEPIPVSQQLDRTAESRQTGSFNQN